MTDANVQKIEVGDLVWFIKNQESFDWGKVKDVSRDKVVISIGWYDEIIRLKWDQVLIKEKAKKFGGGGISD